MMAASSCYWLDDDGIELSLARLWRHRAVIGWVMCAALLVEAVNVPPGGGRR